MDDTVKLMQLVCEKNIKKNLACRTLLYGFI